MECDLLQILASDSAQDGCGHSAPLPLGCQDRCLLLSTIHDKTYVKNKNLLKKLFDKKKSCSIVLDRIAIVAWEEEFVPLTYRELIACWQDLVNKKLVPQENSDHLLYNLYHLSDRSWLTLSGLSDCVPPLIYPPSLFHLLRPHIDDSMLPTVLEQLMGAIKEGARGGGRFGTNPKVIVPAVVAGPTAATCSVIM
jgi:hypothetical protein